MQTVDIEDKTRQPSLPELSAFVDNPLFDELCREMENAYRAAEKIEFSGDRVLYGWNVKFKRAGRTLCTVYPRSGCFPLLLVVGQREKARVEALLPSFSAEFRKVYQDTQEGMGQRWLLFTLHARTPLYEDIRKVVDIRNQKHQENGRKA